MPEFDVASTALILVALFLGGALKGATGAGTPIIAVPVMAAFFDVRLAVVIMVVPNLLSNLGQFWQFRAHRLADGFDIRFAIAGAVGALIGTVVLATFPVRVLTLGVALAVVLYLALRLTRPDFVLAHATARRWVFPAGISAGVLQGAAGISAPISVSFLNAMRLDRPTFITTISAFFAAMSAVQLPAQFVAGLMTPTLLGISILALVPIFVAMPIGSWAARRLSPEGFDRLILVLLSVLAIRLIYSAFM